VLLKPDVPNIRTKMRFLLLVLFGPGCLDSGEKVEFEPEMRLDLRTENRKVASSPPRHPWHRQSFHGAGLVCGGRREGGKGGKGGPNR
jgi:hypothetical protein